MTAEFTTVPGPPDGAGAGPPAGVPVLAVVGEVDLANAAAFDRAVGGAAEDGRVAVDLSGVTYLDSAGVRVLLERAVALDLHLLLPARGVVGPVVRLAGLGEVATVHAAGG